jgi:hypothetical protein
MPEMRAEVNRFKDVLEKAYPPPEGAYLKVKTEPHDFGSYMSVFVAFDETNQEAIDYAFMLEGNIPGTWNELERLAEKNATS